MSRNKQGKIITLVAPSGSGKTTIANRMLATFPEIRFSISATTRPPRRGEQKGIDYFYLSEEEFNQKIKDGGFLEWEEVYDGTRYGTLRSQVDKMIENGYFPLLDIEVKGASNVKSLYGSKCTTIFIHPPSLDELKKRLVKRGSETEHSLQERIDRAKKELKYADTFDYVIVNDDLETACKQVKTILKSFTSFK